MGSNLAVSLTELEDILFSEEDILLRVENSDQIIEMCTTEGQELGFASLVDLKQYITENEDAGSKFYIRTYQAAEWISLYEHPSFQRRKPQLVALSSLNETEDDTDLDFYILRFGQKAGPFHKSDVLTMLDRKDVLLTDMISHDGGHTWNKLYLDENFDRRSLKGAEQLPGVPNQVISSSQGETTRKIKPETDALSSLAYLSNVKRGKSIEREKVEFFQEEMTKKAGSSSLYKWLLVGSLIGIGYFLYSIKNQLLSPFKEAEQTTIGEQAEMLTPVNMEEAGAFGNPRTAPLPRGQVNDQRRMGGKFETRQLDPIAPNRAPRKSFMESAKYQEIQNADPGNNGGEDPNYFYDNSSPMELDPVRSQVSKENYEEPVEGEGPIPSSDTLFESETPN
jgi:hypothetical protein